MVDRLRQALGISDPPQDRSPQVLTPERLAQALDTGALNDAQRVEAFALLAYLRQVAALSPDAFAQRYPFPRPMPPQSRTPADWLRYCLELTPPFQTTVPDQLRDTRYPGRRPGGYVCRDYAALIEALTAACSRYALLATVWRQLPDHIAPALGESVVEELSVAHGFFQFLRAKEHVLPPIKGLRSATVQAAFTLTTRVLTALRAAETPVLFAQFQRHQFGRCYTELLTDMAAAFATHGPAKGYGPVAIQHALSQMLTPLMWVPRGLLPADCTTPGAIQRRLSRRRARG